MHERRHLLNQYALVVGYFTIVSTEAKCRILMSEEFVLCVV